MTDSTTTSPSWIADDELAKEFGIETKQLRAASVRGEFPKPLRIGRAWRYSRAAVDAWLATQADGSAP